MPDIIGDFVDGAEGLVRLIVALIVIYLLIKIAMAITSVI